MMGTYENRIKHKSEQLGWGTVMTSSVAGKFGIPKASQTALNQAFNGLKELATHETALPLDLLLGRFLKMVQALEPFDLRLSDPEKAKQLLEDFESGRLVVKITREEPTAVLQGVYLLETSPGKLFQGVQHGKPHFGFPGTPIADEQIADTTAGLLKDLGYSCRVILTQARIRDEQLAKNLSDLGFILQEKEDSSGIETN
jgi:hypothetical protein